MDRLTRSFTSTIIIFLSLIVLGHWFAPTAIAASLQWTKANGIDSYSQEVRIAPSNAAIAYATIRYSGLSGLYRSDDGGQNFILKFPLVLGRDVNSIAVSHSNPNMLCIGTYEQGVFCSTDGGDNFTNAGWINSGLQNIAVRFITVDPTNDATYYAGTGISNTDGGIYKTTDRGLTWIKVGASTYGDRNSLNIHVDESNNNRVFAGNDAGLYRSLDAGATWTVVLPLNAFLPATIVDTIIPSVVYSSIYNQGIYKSTSNGDPDTWSLRNSTMGTSIVFRLAQDSDGALYVSRVSSSGRLWRSTDRAETWEDVADPSWETRNTWGLDARSGRILVSVEGLGIFAANADGSPVNPPPNPTHKACVNNACKIVNGAGTDTCQVDSECLPPGPDPVVVVPGFGGSWSDKAIIFHQPTDYHDWTMMPFKAPSIYNPFLDSLAADGLQKGQNSFFFAYDFTRPVVDTAGWLNEFLANEVMPKNPGKKVDIVAHSMGGLLARTCFSQISGCREKINKIVSAGTPHRGAVDDYNFWEGADLSSLDPLARFGAKLLLHFDGFPKWNEVNIIQEKVFGAKDFLPVFDYILGKPVWSLSPLAQNWFLANLPMDFASQTLALSGNKPNSTTSYLRVSPPNKKEFANGYWIDGKPKVVAKDLGDGTVLNSSSSLLGAQNKSYNISHDGYLNTLVPINDILQFLGLPQANTLPVTKAVNSATIYYGSSPDVTINMESANGEIISQTNPHSVFVLNSKPQERSLAVSAKKSGNYTIRAWYSDDQGKDIDAEPIDIKLSAGEKKKIEVEFK